MLAAPRGVSLVSWKDKRRCYSTCCTLPCHLQHLRETDAQPCTAAGAPCGWLHVHGRSQANGPCIFPTVQSVASNPSICILRLRAVLAARTSHIATPTDAAGFGAAIGGGTGGGSMVTSRKELEMPVLSPSPLACAAGSEAVAKDIVCNALSSTCA